MRESFTEESKLLECDEKKSRGNADFSGHEMSNSVQEVLPHSPEIDNKKMLIGVLIVIGIAISWVGSTQLAQSAFSADFNAPFLITWFSTSWMSTVFPLYILPSLLRGIRIRSFYRECEAVFGTRGLQLRTVFQYVGPFCLLWMVTNFLYVSALGVIPATDVTALFSSCNAFVYIFSLIWLKEKLAIVKMVAVTTCIGGIVLMAYAEGFKGPNAVGVTLSAGAAVGAALYKVWFKRIVGDATLGQVSLFLSCLGLLNTVLLWPIVLIFYYTHYEFFNWGNIPWKFLCGNAVLGLIFNFLINFGIAFTYPLFISLGTVLGIPINALTDFVFRGAQFGSCKIVAAFSIVIGFLFMLLPAETEVVLREIICCRFISK